MGKTSGHGFLKVALSLWSTLRPMKASAHSYRIRLPAKAQAGGLERSAGGWKGLIDAEELKRNIYADRLISTRPEPRL